MDKAWHLLKAGAITNLLCSDVTARASRLQRAIALSGGGDDAAQQSPRPMCVEPQSAPPDREAGAPPPGAPKSNGWGSALLRPQPSASSCAGFQMPIAPIPGARDAPPQSNGWGSASICPQTSASSCAGFQLPIPPIPPAIPIGAPPRFDAAADAAVHWPGPSAWRRRCWPLHFCVCIYIDRGATG